MLGRLFSVVFVVILGWLLGRLLRLSSRGRPAQGRPRSAAGGAPRAAGVMVRDRVCNTYLPRPQALTVNRGGQEHFFCSESCRGRFLDDPADVAAPGRD